MLGGILLSIHNLHYLIDLMRRAREAVLADAYEEFYQEWDGEPRGEGLLGGICARAGSGKRRIFPG